MAVLKEAADAFRKATEADPNYADAYYQLGVSLTGMASLDPKTGKVSDFRRYTGRTNGIVVGEVTADRPRMDVARALSCDPGKACVFHSAIRKKHRRCCVRWTRRSMSASI